MTLQKVSSRGAMVVGSWYCDIALGTVYVWPFGSVNPTDTVSVFAASDADTAVTWNKADGSDARLITHHRCYINGYSTFPFGTMSPDGLAVMFSSNMGNSTGRSKYNSMRTVSLQKLNLCVLFS